MHTPIKYSAFLVLFACPLLLVGTVKAFPVAVTHETCCTRAQAAGKECTHKCCVNARKNGRVCEKCNGKPEKKEDAK